MVDVKILEMFDRTAVIKLPIEGFEKLSLNDKIIAYHLSQAGIIGDAITYDQCYRHGLKLRDFFLKIITYRKSIKKSVYEKILAYTKKIILNKGNHDSWSTKKFFPEFTEDELREALGSIGDMNLFLEDDFVNVIFNPEFDVMLTKKAPEKDDDMITSSHANFYNNITSKDLEGFTDLNPNNSTIFKEHGEIVEKIWRSGNDTIPKGLYAQYLKKINTHLELAAQFAKEDQKDNILLLKKYFEEGKPKDCDDYNIGWVRMNPAIDTIFGFIEEYKDVRSKKGLFESMVYFTDKEVTQIISKVSSHVQDFEDRAPWEQKYKRKWTKIPVSNAITLIIGTGGAGPLTWSGVNLPNSQELKDKYGSKSILIWNTTACSRMAFAHSAYDEFLYTKEEKNAMLDTMKLRSILATTLHEVVGHGAGISLTEKDPQEYLKELYSTLEEARAECCALYHIWDPALSEIHVDKKHAEMTSLYYVLMGLMNHRRFDDAEIHEDHDRATQMIVQFLLEHKAAEYIFVEGKYYPHVIDYTLYKKTVGQLLSELMRIKAEGDHDSGKELIEKYARFYDKNIQKNIVERCKKINYPSYYAYVMPILTSHEKHGKIVDITAEYPDDIIDQAMKWKEIEEK